MSLLVHQIVRLFGSPSLNKKNKTTSYHATLVVCWTGSREQHSLSRQDRQRAPRHPKGRVGTQRRPKGAPRRSRKS